jgi:hypothetical protein
LRGCPRLSLYEPVLMESGQPSIKHRAGPLNHVSNKTYFNETWAAQAHSTEGHSQDQVAYIIHQN